MMVSVIIVNYNTFQLTSDCIRSVIQLTKDIDYEIIVVDNASTQMNPDQFLDEFPGIILVKNETNAGFAAGNNLGIAKAKGEYLLLLNSDTYFRENSIWRSVTELQAKKYIGVLGCRMIYPDGKVQYTARRFRSVGWELLDLFRFIPMFMPYEKRAKKMLGKYFRHDESMECDWLNGAFFLFPASILAQLEEGKLDERFFMYGEDQLWCEQIRKKGYSIYFFAGTTIVHIHSGSTDPKKQLALRRTMMKHERKIMQLRKGKGLYYILFNIIYTLKEGVRNLVKRIIFRSTRRMIR
jgi:GT2 family glycosyltransferase